MKKILHLFRSSQFTEGFIDSINNYSLNSEHFFLVYGTAFLTDKCEYLYEDNIRYVLTMQFELRKPFLADYFDSFDLIIYHGVFDDVILRFFYNNLFLLKKLYLYFWGGDIPLVGTEEENKIKKTVINKAEGIIVIVDSDYKRIVDLYQPKGQFFCMQYCDEKQLEFMKKYLRPELVEKEEIYIQVGNSATETNNHIEVFRKLEKYKDEKIKVFVPLAYGDMKYANEVTHYAKEIFGNKVNVLMDMLSIDEYIKMLSKIDIGIFAMDRQQALGNIYMLGMNGSKLFIKRGGQLDDYLSNQLKCHVSYIDQIEKMSFDEFIHFTQNKRVENSERILEINETEYKMKKWNDFFERDYLRTT